MKKSIRMAYMFLLFSLIFGTMCSCGNKSMKYYIFSEITECNNFTIDKKGGAEIIEYDTPDDDRYLENMKYKNFFAAKYKSSEFEFEIFAYEFENSDSAKEYFKNATGRTSDLDTNFLSSGGITSQKIVVINFEKAYTLYTSADSSEQVKKFIGENFTIQITN